MRHFIDGASVVPTYTQQPLALTAELTVSLNEGETTAITKEVLVVTSRDVPETQQITRVNELFSEMTTLYPEAKAGQGAAWAKRWQLADVVIEGDDEAQQGIRFNLFQLFSTYYGEDDRLNIGPKGFTGEKYGGATYWDTEAYAVPLYLALAKPRSY